MATDPRHELASTYMVEDRGNLDEIARLQIQDHLLTASMGGVLAEQTEMAQMRQVLDVGCGPGGWLLEVAQAYPHFSWLVGIDISQEMLAVAREQARVLHLEQRISFQHMDALRMLEFANASFDLVNQRAGISWLRRWEWPKLVQEYVRVLRPGGIVRITEVNGALESSSPALSRLWNLAAEAFYAAGISFSRSGDHLDEVLAELLTRHGVKQVQVHPALLDYQAGTQQGQLFLEDMRRLFRTIKPFLERWLRVPEEYDTWYTSMLQECAEPDFSASARLFTLWGTR